MMFPHRLSLRISVFCLITALYIRSPGTTLGRPSSLRDCYCLNHPFAVLDVVDADAATIVPVVETAVAAGKVVVDDSAVSVFVVVVAAAAALSDVSDPLAVVAV